MSPTNGPLLPAKIAVVTGGGAGIGGGISRAFAEQGARVAVVDIDAERARATVVDIVRAGHQALAVVGDVRRAHDVARIVDEVVATFGDVDILVNNVGDYLFGGFDFATSTEEQWQELYETNLLHVMRMTRAVVPAMIKRGSGVLMTLSTVEAFRAVPGQAVYGAFKAGAAHFMKSLAVGLAPHGIRCIDLAPDVTQTPQLPYDRWLTDDDRAKVPLWVPVGRLGSPADFGMLAAFLASDHAGSVTGVSIPVDGGTLAAGGWYRTNRPGRAWTNRPHEP
jgi:2-hydroxycyclohexanecarboxyl-CoA dehydrogenase